tara:strand:- start:145 stop:516 length:372 start_codon:yes stop_codon:yes gene_type:complete
MMKIFETITHSNFELFAAQHYNNPECTSVDEFKEDLSRFKYLKRLLKRYEQAGDLQERLILNHLIVLYNVFGIEAADRMLWYKVDENHWPIIKTFLVFLHYLEESHKVEIPLDNNVIQRLREL